MYKPTFTITNYMLQKSISISNKLGKISVYDSLERMPILRRNNKIMSIHSSLVIEGNSLAIEQVKDVINGKLVIGPQRDIQEVKNAYKAYEMIDKLDGFNEKDLLKVHGVLTYLIDEESGRYRNHGEEVKDGDVVIFIAPPEELVPGLMKDLFTWLINDEEVPLLIRSCIFHYELLFIHPFGDGNGRTARLWQNVILSKWNDIFKYMPIESQIKKYQEEYYKAIDDCNGNLNVFIEFMLRMIDETLDEIIDKFKNESRNISDQVNKLLQIMDEDVPLSANEIMTRLNIKSKETLRGTYLNPSLKNGLIKMTLPDKPNSKNQKYYK